MSSVVREAWLRKRAATSQLDTALLQRRSRDDLAADIAADLLFRAGRFSRTITVNPPSGYAAYPISVAAATSGADSIFAYLSGVTPKDLDQAVVPTTYSGGTITWELSGGRMTGRIASVTGGGDGILSIDYWRESTRATSTYSVIMQGGDIAAAFTAASAGISQEQTIGSPSLDIPAATLTVNSLYQDNALASPSLTQTHELTPAGLSQQQAIENSDFTTSATYSRSITFNPPAGETARPVLASVARLTAYSFFSYLGFSPADGDQAVTPDTWSDSGTPRAIVWETDGSGHPTGVVTSVANGPTTVDIDYWRQSTGTWSTVTMTVVTPVTLSVNNVTTVQALADSAAIPPGSLSVNGIATVQAIEVGQVASGGGAPVKYTREITLNPPAGRIAYPVSAASAVQGPQSVFSLLQGTVTTGDQAAPPISYVDGASVTRAITWELDGSGNMTGRIAEIDGNGVTTLTIPYWDSTTGTWYTITAPLQDYQEGLIAQSIVSVQTVAASSVGIVGGVQPANVVSQQVLFPANLALQYSILPNPVVQLQDLGVAGISTLGSLGAFSIITDQVLESPTLNQLSTLQPASVITVQTVGVGPLNAFFTLSPDNITTVQALASAQAVPVGTLAPANLFTTQLIGISQVLVGSTLMPSRIDTRQTIEKVVLNMPAMGSISAKLTLYPAVWGNISLRSD